MRLWNKDLIPYLPRKQLLGQWRECCLIAKNMAEKGTPNHILVNKIMDYPLEHFVRYAHEVCSELQLRKYECNFTKIMKYFSSLYYTFAQQISFEEVFKNWHNERYLKQCMYNLEEKHDCQGITDDEWNVLLRGYREITGKDWGN